MTDIRIFNSNKLFFQIFEHSLLTQKFKLAKISRQVTNTSGFESALFDHSKHSLHTSVKKVITFRSKGLEESWSSWSIVVIALSRNRIEQEQKNVFNVSRRQNSAGKNSRNGGTVAEIAGPAPEVVRVQESWRLRDGLHRRGPGANFTKLFTVVILQCS
jgi:hypothetical protein